MDELKPCPFCGGEAQCSGFETDYPAQNFQIYVKCHNCGAGIHAEGRILIAKKLEQVVIKAWNRRAAPENNPQGLQTTWETPDTCDNCHEHLAEDWSYCPECGRPTGENKPLALDELQRMDGEPVYMVDLTGGALWTRWTIFDRHDDNGFVPRGGGYFRIMTYGKLWLAYAHKPEQEDTK